MTTATSETMVAADVDADAENFAALKVNEDGVEAVRCSIRRFEHNAVCVFR